ncbi:MAG TPA: carbonic anhydrase [Candidatus Acidoferrum sp.]|nr:carbonic anhydrase [Candidatus Acidoferrum sp.]
MSQIYNQVMGANQRYAAGFGDKARLAMPPAKHFAILTCMDARLDPAQYAGLAEGDAHVIRNAGGRATDDAIRSLVISYKLLGTREWFVIHHTDCGMQTFTDEVMRRLLASSLQTAIFDGKEWKDPGKGQGSTEGEFVDWLTIRDQHESVVADVRRLRNHPLVPAEIPIYGLIFDVRTGKLLEVPEAVAFGAPMQQAWSRAA